ncbi:hypothetical protein CspeluHIS016_0301060 [Cutaneotrichosporon spelunceum]|uniref:Signal recognition particle subunit SRP14 n=1 Tax=Cutaneotrichosporon spelunceum TaxID=1672016 RepID=A0AAD3TTL4_9TREE|nr:hypothetical protein CspeluHIS016_0301060 [Cutaneotrichosporon spelunceum]
MSKELVTPDEFLARLTAMFDGPSKSSIWLTHKRYTYDDAMTDPEAEYDVLVRCTQGETKLSARIPASTLPTFHAAYGALLKQSMAPHMRKRDKKKERARAEAAEKRRKELYVDVVIGTEGKRGAGRRKRQRQIAAQKKKEAERERIELREAARAAAVKDE